MLRAYIDLTVNTFLTLNPDEIMGRLSSAHPFDLEMNQRDGDFCSRGRQERSHKETRILRSNI
jgi:hypothetical protein